MSNTRTTKLYSYFGKEALAGGLNVSDNPLIISPAEMTVAENISIAQSLGRRKRPGLENYGLSSFSSTASWPVAGSPIRGVIQYWRYVSGAGNAVEDIFLHSQNKVYSIENRISPAVNRTGAATLSSTGVPQYQVFQGVLFFCNSDTADGYKKWDGTTGSPGDIQNANPPPDGPGKYLGVFGGRMIMSGNPDFPFRVYISAPFDGETWSGLGTTSFDLDYDGDPTGVTAIFPDLDGNLYISTQRSIYALFATDLDDVSTFQIQRITRGIGCISARTVVATANDILFVSQRGLHSLKKIIVSDQTEITFLSRPVQKIFTEQIAFNLIEQAQAVWDETQNLYILSVPSSGQTKNDVLLVYNVTFAIWTTWTGVEARSLAPLLLSGKQYILAGRENGSVAFLNPIAKNDDGTGFSAKFRSGKMFPGGDITTRKSFKAITVLVSSTNIANINIGWYIDDTEKTHVGSAVLSLGRDSALLGQTFILGASRLGVGRFLPFTVPINEHGHNFQLEISVSGDSDMEFYGYVLEVEDENETFGS